MATRSFTADDETTAGIGPIDRISAGAGRILRYQLNVVASSTEDAVRSAGGWLCDRARAGWHVNVRVADGGDPRSLAILGAAALELDEDFVSMVRSASRVGTLALSADLLGADPHMREEVLRVLKRGLTEVSAAARAFKSHALVAADVSTDSVTPTETLFRVGTGSFRVLHSV